MTHPAGGTCTAPDCDQLVADAWVCSTCTHRLRVALTDAPDLLAELDIDLTRQSRTGTRIGGRTAERPLPYDPAASLVRDALTSTLRTWCLVLAGDLLGQAPADEDLVEHLADRIEAVRHHIEGGTLVDEVCAAVTIARTHLHRDHDPTLLAGNCPTCGHTVYARHGAATARCHTPDCDGVVDVAAWRLRARQSLPTRTLPMAQLLRALAVLGHDVPEGTVKSWIHRGHLQPTGTRDGRHVYRVADAIALTTRKANAS
jgi:hypothetical protein